MSRSNERVQVDDLPEPIAIAERWREAGKVLSVRSPEVFAEMLSMFEAWAVAAAQAADEKIDKVYSEA